VRQTLTSRWDRSRRSNIVFPLRYLLPGAVRRLTPNPKCIGQLSAGAGGKFALSSFLQRTLRIRGALIADEPLQLAVFADDQPASNPCGHGQSTQCPCNRAGITEWSRADLPAPHRLSAFLPEARARAFSAAAKARRISGEGLGSARGEAMNEATTSKVARTIPTVIVHAIAGAGGRH
jgi:hypothetical protein